MAKLRSVNTRFWVDEYVAELSVDEKLLFLYLLTCPASNIAGVYEITYRQISFDTGITTEKVSKAFVKLSADNKLHYVAGYVILVNHFKNQKFNPSMETTRKSIIKALPAAVRAAYDAAMVSDIAHDDGTVPHDDGTMKTDAPAPVIPPPPTVEPKAKKKRVPIGTVDERRDAFRGTVWDMAYVVKYGEKMLQRFFNYWTELNAPKTRMRFEMERTWEIAKRLNTWHARDIERQSGHGSATSHQLYRE